MGLQEPPLTGEEKYAQLEEIWEVQGMQSFRDYLEYYNSLDTKPFCQAVTRMLDVYRSMDLDIFKQAISAPGLSRILLFRSARKANVSFSLINHRDKDIHTLLKKTLTGGPSLIFTRHASSEEGTLIRGGPEKCQGVTGLDFANLYGWCLRQPLPSGPYIRRFERDDYKAWKSEKYLMAYYWLDYTAKTRNIEISHYLSHGKETRICGLPVDGFVKPGPGDTHKGIIFQFQGCFWHSCEKCVDLPEDDEKREEMLKRREKTRKTTEMFRQAGYVVEECYECEFKAMIKSNPELKEFIDERQPTFFRQTHYKKT